MMCAERNRAARQGWWEAVIALVRANGARRTTAYFLPFRIETFQHETVQKRILQRAGYSASTSVIFFLCFTGLRRLSGIVRSVGGMPRPRRASRRASL